MSQTGYTPILIYSSSTGGNLPAAGNLTNSTLGSELAINITDGKLFYKDNANAVQVIGWKTTPTSAGGTGLTSYTAGDLLYYASGTTLSKLAIGATGRYLSSSGTAPQWSAPAALTKTDDTNVTLTLGGSASTALLNAASLTLGWTGTLAVSRGGTGTGTAFTAGSVVFAGASGVYSQNNANFFWDNTNIRLGIGTATPRDVGVFSGTPVSVGGSASGNLFDIVNSSTAYNASPTAGMSFWTKYTSAGATYPMGYISAGKANATDGDNAGYLAFHTTTNGGSWTEAMRIFASSGVSIGNTTDPGATNLYVSGYIQAGNSSGAGKMESYINSATVPAMYARQDGAAYIQHWTIAGGTTRAYMKTDGGLGNYSANDVNLSDERMKTDISLAGNYLEKICAIPVKTFKYKDQSDDLLTLGVIAQDVELVAPELVDTTGWGSEIDQPTDGVPLKSIYQTDLQYALMKCIQELTERVAKLEGTK